MTESVTQKQSDTFFLCILFAISAIVRLSALFCYFQHNPCMTMYDAGHYHSLAQSLLQGLSFVGADGAPYFYRLPGYPVFLAGCYLLFGVQPIFALGVQCLVASFIPVLIFLLARELCSEQRTVAVVASVVSCFHVGYVIYANLLMAETLFLLFFLLFYINLLKNKFVVAGLFLGFSSLIRPVGHFILLITVLQIFAEYFGLIKSLLKNIVGLLCGWLVIVGWWITRNYLLTGMIFFHTLSGPHFINHSAVRIIQSEKNISYEQAKKIVYEHVEHEIFCCEQLLGRSLNHAEESLIMERVAFAIMKSHWIQAARLFLINIFKTTFSLYSSELLVIEQNGELPVYCSNRGFGSMIARFLFPKVKNWFILVVVYYELFVWFLILVGFSLFCFCSIFFRSWFEKLIKIIPQIALMIVLSCACGFARFRLPIEHFFIIFASIFWINCWYALKKRRLFLK